MLIGCSVCGPVHGIALCRHLLFFVKHSTRKTKLLRQDDLMRQCHMTSQSKRLRSRASGYRENRQRAHIGTNAGHHPANTSATPTNVDQHDSKLLQRPTQTLFEGNVSRCEWHVTRLRAKSVATPHRCLATATMGLRLPSRKRDGRPAMLRSRMSILALVVTPSSRFSAWRSRHRVKRGSQRHAQRVPTAWVQQRENVG